MNCQIPALKAKAEWLPWALQCIRDYSGSYRRIENCIMAKWSNASRRTKAPSTKNSLRAVFGPTLRHLQLVMGEGDRLELMSKGKELLNLYEEQGEIAFKKALARHLIKLDKERWGGLIFLIDKLGGDTTDDKVLNEMEGKQEGQLTMDKLRKALLYYVYVGLLTFEGKTIKLRSPTLKNLLKGVDVKVSSSQFAEALIQSYNRLQPASGGNPYIPIPALREAVCEDLGFWPDDFYRLLEEIPKENSEYLIHLSQPMVRKLGGIKLGDKYLYYVAIYKKKEGGEAQ
jgi:hypothetical protein